MVGELQAQHSHDDSHDHSHDHSYHLHKVYELDWKKKEIITLGTGIGLTALGHVMLSRADGPIQSDIDNLDGSQLNFIDRTAANNLSESARNLSDIVLIGGLTLPFLSYFSSNCRPEAGTIGVMAVETFLINLGITNISKAAFKRYRPYNYNPDAPAELQLGKESRRSFISGHASSTTALAFLTARVLTDAHPESSKKYIIWSAAATIPAVISYLRVKAGRHFPTDVIGGYVVGATIGYLIPEIHLRDHIDIEVQGVGSLSVTVSF